MTESEQSLHALLEAVSTDKNLKEDELRMAVGFLDTDRLNAEISGYKMFVALVSMTRNLGPKRQFCIPVRELMDEIGLKHNNYQRIEESVEFLMSTLLTFNVNRQDNNPGWSKSQILGPTRMENGLLYTEFTEPVWEKLRNPLVYAYITKRGVYHFSGKHELALYNWFSRLLVPNYKAIYVVESIAYILQQILHLDPKETTTYTRYKYLNQKILSRAVQTINEKTNLYVEYEGLKEVNLDTLELGPAQKLFQHIEFPVTVKKGKGGVEYQKKSRCTPKSRKIQYVSFRVWQKANAPEAIEVSSSETKGLPEGIEKYLGYMIAEGLVMDKGIEEHVTERLNQAGEAACLEHVTQVWKQYLNMKKRQTVGNPGGYLRKMLFEQKTVPQTKAESKVNADWEQYLVPYAELLRQAREKVFSKAILADFADYLRADYVHYEPRLKALCKTEKALQLSSRGLDLSDAEAVLQKESFVSLLKGHHQVFGYEIPSSEQRETVLVPYHGDILKTAKSQADPVFLTQLQDVLRQHKMSFKAFEQKAFLL